MNKNITIAGTKINKNTTNMLIKAVNHPASNTISSNELLPKIFFEKIELSDLQDYMEAKRVNSRIDYSLNEFVSQRSNYNKKNTIIIADLSNQKIGSNKSLQLLDLKGAVFTGSLIQNIVFSLCNLEGAYFCGIHLQDVEFIDSNINFVDFRRADLGSCKFSDNYRDPPWNLVEGIKLGSKASCIRVYADIKNDTAKKNEQKRLLESKRLELLAIKSKTPLMTRLGLFSNLVDSSVAYKRAHRELYKMQKGIFHTNNIIHTSFYNIFKAEQCVFDPMLLTGESFCDNSIQKKLVPLSRKNLAEYLQRVKQERGLSLNEFAKELYVGSLNKATKIDKHLKIIADLSSKVNAFGNNEWHRVNLSGLDFSNTDLSETIFSGSDLCKCNFTGANLSNANFESALIQEAIFCNTILRKSNFYCTDISKSRFTDSKLMYARFDWSVAVSASFKSVNLEFLQAPNSNWQNIKIENSQMSYGDFTKTNFQGAEFQKVTFKHSIFNKTLFDKANFINCDLSESLFNEAVLKHVIWDRCMAQNIEMRHANLTGGKISEYCNFEKADFSYAILDGIKAPRAHFAGAIMEHVKIGYGKLAASCLDGASLKFSDLNSCVLSESSCIGTDFTGAKLFNIKMVRSSLKSSVLVGAIIQDSSFNKTNCEDSNWQSAKFIEVILDHVNNHRIKINDNTEFVNCSLKELNGQFYHYDEDAFMDIMFVEQLEMNIAKIDRAELLRKIGIFSFVLRLVSAEYKAISRKEVKRLHNIKLHNSKELKQYLKKLNDQERAGRDLNKLKVMNLLMQASH